jgi:hypothetical protein
MYYMGVELTLLRTVIEALMALSVLGYIRLEIQVFAYRYPLDRLD